MKDRDIFMEDVTTDIMQNRALKSSPRIEFNGKIDSLIAEIFYMSYHLGFPQYLTDIRIEVEAVYLVLSGAINEIVFDVEEINRDFNHFKPETTQQWVCINKLRVQAREVERYAVGHTREIPNMNKSIINYFNNLSRVLANLRYKEGEHEFIISQF